ncbi:element excision factor XisH family protein [Leptolyngbya sp. NIES-2104]|uniref:element excision factor XisH family protein n=1 Tax=Leptolyngbya sp. NIES-2104 TaxID=1552121 RepID=UPI001CEC5567|nr:element excision factor XisH family protein [Leptolyngbya sp. NIES-2104]
MNLLTGRTLVSAKDLFHEAVKQALIRDGWSITDNPLVVRYGPTNLKVDLGAERMIAAQRDAETIAVEIKSFLDPSAVNDFHTAVGQYLHYQLAFRYNQWSRKLYLAVPKEIYETQFEKPLFQDSIQTYGTKILVYGAENQEIVAWIE